MRSTRYTSSPAAAPGSAAGERPAVTTAMQNLTRALKSTPHLATFFSYARLGERNRHAFSRGPKAVTGFSQAPDLNGRPHGVKVPPRTWIPKLAGHLRNTARLAKLTGTGGLLPDAPARTSLASLAAATPSPADDDRLRLQSRSSILSSAFLFRGLSRSQGASPPAGATRSSIESAATRLRTIASSRPESPSNNPLQWLAAKGLAPFSEAGAKTTARLRTPNIPLDARTLIPVTNSFVAKSSLPALRFDPDSKITSLSQRSGRDGDRIAPITRLTPPSNQLAAPHREIRTLLERLREIHPGPQYHHDHLGSVPHPSRFSSRSSSPFASSSINYSPTVVVNPPGPSTDIEEQVLHAMRRHAYELSAILEREDARKRRTAL